LLNKDVGICLTANKQRSHAYVPALMTCISFLDLLSGLHAGKLKGQSVAELVAYAGRFMNAAHYPKLELSVLYEMMRHKIAPWTPVSSSRFVYVNKAPRLSANACYLDFVRWKSTVTP
jgi:hypothetical protein